MKKNLYLIGESGLVSKYLKKNFKFKNVFSLRKINEIHLTDLKSNQENLFILLSQPGGIEFCEKNPKKISLFLDKIDILLKKINKNSQFIFLSSDAVYSKKLKYGKIKLKIEKKIIKRFNKFNILRSCKIFSKNLRDKTEYHKVYKALRNKNYYFAFHDQYCHYIEISKVLKIFKKLISSNTKKKYGITNIFDKKIYTSRYEFAKKVALDKKLNLKYLKMSTILDSKLPLPKKLFLNK